VTLTVALSLWVGGLVALTLVAAPVIFRTAGSRHLAGAIFGSLLRTFGWVEIALGVIAAIALSVQIATTSSLSTGDWLRMAGLALMIVLLFISTFAISPAMHELRPKCGSFDSAPAGPGEIDARLQFDTLHRWSERVVGTIMIAGLAVLTLTVLRRP